MTFAKELPNKLSYTLIALVGIIILLMATAIGTLYLRIFDSPTRAEVKEDMISLKAELKSNIADQRISVNEIMKSQEMLILAKLDSIRMTSEGNRAHLIKLDDQVRNLSSEVSSLVGILKRNFEQNKEAH